MYVHVHTGSQIEVLKIHTLYFNDPFHQVYSFGNGSGVGKGTTEPRQYTPWLIEPLEGEMIIDVCTGDGHCLALTQSKSLNSFYCVCSLDYRSLRKLLARLRTTPAHVCTVYCR